MGEVTSKDKEVIGIPYLLRGTGIDHVSCSSNEAGPIVPSSGPEPIYDEPRYQSLESVETSTTVYYDTSKGR